MSFSNLEYFYSNLPARYRRADSELFLKRYLTFIGTTLDEWDAKFDNFFENIEAATAETIWIEFWLKELFDWTFFPEWFGLEEKRRLYGNFAKHLARRGTARGIELWFADFNVAVKVYNRPVFWGEFVWGENAVSIAEPLRTIIEILQANPLANDFSGFGESVWGESFYADQKPILSQLEFAGLLKFQQPHGQDFVVVWQTKEPTAEPRIFNNADGDNFITESGNTFS